MECKIRCWRIEDAEDIAETLNNKNILDNLRDGIQGRTLAFSPYHCRSAGANSPGISIGAGAAASLSSLDIRSDIPAVQVGFLLVCQTVYSNAPCFQTAAGHQMIDLIGDINHLILQPVFIIPHIKR